MRLYVCLFIQNKLLQYVLFVSSFCLHLHLLYLSWPSHPELYLLVYVIIQYKKVNMVKWEKCHYNMKVSYYIRNSITLSSVVLWLPISAVSPPRNHFITTELAFHAEYSYLLSIETYCQRECVCVRSVHMLKILGSDWSREESTLSPLFLLHWQFPGNLPIPSL